MPPLSSVSLIDEHGERRVRMGTLAFVGSHKVNGVSALHTELMRRTVFRSLHSSIRTGSSTRPTASPSAAGCSPPILGLTALLCDAIGPEVLDDPMALERLAPLADDAALHERLIAVRRANKVALADWSRSGWTSRSTRTRWSTCTSSASTNTSGSC